MYENKSGLCIASMILGIISLIATLFLGVGFLPGVLGLIFAIVCLAKKKQPKGCAIAGLITSIIGTVINTISFIIWAVGLVLLGMLIVGGATLVLSVFTFLAGLSDLSQMNQALDMPESIVSILDDLEEEDYSNSFNWDDFTSDYDWSDYTGDYDWSDFTGDYDWSDYTGDYDWSDYTGDTDWDYSGYDSDSHEMTLEETYFEDLENYGFYYAYGGSDYNVYTNNNGAEIEFPAYVYDDYHEFGSTPFKAYDKIITQDGIKDSGMYYDDQIYDDLSGVKEWEYSYAELVNEYNEYEIEIFAFNKNNDDLVMLILRPSNYDTESAAFKEDFDDFINTMKYMHSAGSY